MARIAQFHQLSILSVYEELPNGAFFSNPLVFIINKNKKTENYKLIFDHIKSMTIKPENLGQTFSPTLIHVDFELSQKNGILQVFPDVEILHCFFHYTQSIRRNLCVRGFKKKLDYNGPESCPIFQEFFALLCGVASVQLDTPLIKEKVNEILLDYKEKIPFTRGQKAEFEMFLEYFKKFYLKDDAIFPHKTWNMWNNILLGPENFSRTTNVSESVHSQLNKLFTGRNCCLNLLKNLSQFKGNKMSESAAVTYQKVNGCIVQPSKKRKQNNSDRVRLLNIYNIVHGFCRLDIEEKILGLKEFLIRVGSQRRNFFERAPVFVDTILDENLDSP